MNNWTAQIFLIVHCVGLVMVNFVFGYLINMHKSDSVHWLYLREAEFVYLLQPWSKQSFVPFYYSSAHACLT